MTNYPTPGDYPKHINRQLRELAGQAYESELAAALAPLAAKFDEWQAGKIDAGEMSRLVHQFETGPSRELYSYYNAGSSMLALQVASAIVRGFLKEEQVPAAVMPYLEAALDVCRRWSAEGRAAKP